MNIQKKISLIILAGFTLLVVAITYTYARVTEMQLRRQFLERQQLALRQLGTNLSELEKTVDALNSSAVEYLYLVMQGRTIPSTVPSTEELRALAARLGVAHFYITQRDGKFIRSTETSLDELQGKGLFDFCPGYEALIHDSSRRETTPIVPSFPWGRAYKFLMRGSADGKYILESGIHLNFIATILNAILENEKSFRELGIYTPSGTILGQIKRNGQAAASSSIPVPALEHGPLVQPEGNDLRIFVRVAASTQRCCECQVKGVAQGKTDGYYYVVSALVDTRELAATVRAGKLRVFQIGLVALALASLVGWLLGHRVARRFVSLESQISLIISSKDYQRRLRIEGRDEVALTARYINELLDGVESANRERVESAGRENLIRVARQVAHDIRSPLAALDMILKTVGDLEEERRVVIRGAIGRIRDIANSLVARSGHAALASADGASMDSASQNMREELLAPLLDALLTEKRLQYRSRLQVDIELHYGAGAYDAFARVQPGELMRVLSNLVNNAFEALRDGAGHIRLKLSSSHDKVEISVTDDGHGIAPEHLAQLGREGVSFGKESSAEAGTGLGLAHARQCLQRWGGELNIASKINEGSAVTLTLPKIAAAPWFVRRVSVSSATQVVILDDDTSVHRVWEERFRRAAELAQLPAPTLHHLSRPSELRDWVGRETKERRERETVEPRGRETGEPRQPAVPRVIYLCDHELVGFSDTGLSLIRELGLSARAMLVSSHFEDQAVRAEAAQLRLGLIPKTMVNLIPVAVLSAVGADAVPDMILADDDELVRQSWALVAKPRGVQLRSFASAEALLAALHAQAWPVETPLYLDVNLGAPLRGLQLARECHALGYRQIWLATGHDPDKLPLGDLPFLSGVVGKEFPV